MGRVAGGKPHRAEVLRSCGVRFAWGTNQVLKGVDFSLSAGQVVCLMGENGCGKSTFLDCVLGSNVPSGGTLQVFGNDLLRCKAHERARWLSYVPQMHDRGFGYPVEHMVLMGRTVHQRGLGAPDEEDRDLARQAIESCGIGHLRERPCTALSGGEMQMALLARALVQDTPIILLDEPTAHLDFKNELRFMERLESLVIEKKVSVLMATHSPNQALHLSAAGIDVRIALMAEGRVALFDTPEKALTEETLRTYFGIEARVMRDRCSGMFQIIPCKTIEEKRGGSRYGGV